MKYLNGVFVAMLMCVLSSAAFGQAPVPDPIGGGGPGTIEEDPCVALNTAWQEALAALGEAECVKFAAQCAFDAAVADSAAALAAYDAAVAAGAPQQVRDDLFMVWLDKFAISTQKLTELNEANSFLTIARAAEIAAKNAWLAAGCDVV